MEKKSASDNDISMKKGNFHATYNVSSTKKVKFGVRYNVSSTKKRNLELDTTYQALKREIWG